MRRTHFPKTAGIAVVTVIVSLCAAIVTPPAQAVSVSGLFGSQDPTYDGVFRQSLALIALSSQDMPIPPTAARWLIDQQCADGAFEAYRADPAARCKDSDLDTYSGKDTNSTAMAAMALTLIGQESRARKAISWLESTQNADGGIPWLKGGTSDSSSTALTMLALRTVGEPVASFRNAGRSLRMYLRTTVLGCKYPKGQQGAVSFMKSGPLVASDMTTAQVTAALSLAWPISRAVSLAPATRLNCPAGVPNSLSELRAVIAGYSAHRLATTNSQIPSAFGSGTDWSSTAWTVLGLVAARVGGKAVPQAVAGLKANVQDAIRGSDDSVEVGKVSLMLLVAKSQGETGTSFGGVNLRRSLKGLLN